MDFPAGETKSPGSAKSSPSRIWSRWPQVNARFLGRGNQGKTVGDSTARR